jgi:hypothetical protein
MAKRKRETKKARRTTERAIIKEINALMDARVSLAQKKLLDAVPRFIGKGMKPALKALDIPSKKDFDKINAKIASLDKSLNKLLRKKKTGVTPSKPRKKKVEICKVKGCRLPVRCKGYCAKHYQAWRRKKLKGTKKTGTKVCKVKGCNNKHYGKGYCRNHYMQWRRGTLR